MAIHGQYERVEGAGGGGIRIVSELPEPVRGKQPLVVYVEADYYSGERTVSETTFTVTPASLGGDSRGGAPSPALTYVSNIFQDNNRNIYVQMTSLLVALPRATRPGELGVESARGLAAGDSPRRARGRRFGGR